MIAKHKCQKCYKQYDLLDFTKILTVHHIDCNPKNNSPENFLAPCTSYHLREQAKIWREQNYKQQHQNQLQLL